jgi:hypothetical protein
MSNKQYTSSTSITDALKLASERMKAFPNGNPNARRVDAPFSAGSFVAPEETPKRPKQKDSFSP